MARSHARVLVTIWSDPDFRALGVEAQRMYLLLLSQGSLNNAGVLPLTAKRWAAGCHSTTTSDIDKALAELDRARFIAADDETEEVLIRSFIRNDGIVKQPQMMKSALREALTVESARLRSVLAAELRKLRRDDAAFTAEQIDPGFNPDPDPGDRSPIQAQGSLLEGFGESAASHPEHSPKGAELRRGGDGEGEGGSTRNSSVEKTAKRGTRIPDDFAVTQALAVWAHANCPDVDSKFETEQFIDYWMAKPGQQAVKLDWSRTWQTWMREQQRRAIERGPRLRSVPVHAPMLPTEPSAAFDALRDRGDAQAIANLIGDVWHEPAKPPSVKTPLAEWQRAEAVAWIDARRDRAIAALTRKTG